MAKELTEITIAFLGPTFRNSCGPRSTGTRTDSINSSSRSEVVFTPVISSSTCNCLTPDLLLTLTRAPNANNTGIISPAGDAVARFPPIVPVFRIWGDPIVLAD